ncbi:protein SOGA3a isoform X2 [Paramormyrops kingsleyae]|uniref:protein SOGA3a isoform X2 n=1 Tax=Paramormyrops kingsleyae TaxID=1676925 RepID=UPI003B974F88
MLNVFGNGPGLHRGGGGYVGKAHGWEFVPHSQPGGEKCRDGSCGPPKALVRGDQEGLLDRLGATAKAERDPVTWLELQTQHSQLRKKLEDLKKQHEQDKEEWMREKELLLRQVAEIQGGENKRILLDLKSVLEDVQQEVKREEARRRELQVLYAKDRCAWEAERADLHSRIAQLEARVSGPGTDPGLQDGRQRREREEQRRLLSDTHSAAMALRCRLECSERGWTRHRAEVLERFDAERREWELQLRDMQHKVEELCNEVKSHRDRTGMRSSPLRLSLQSSTTGSSILSDSVSRNGSGDRPDSRCDSNPRHHADSADRHSNSEWDAEIEEILQGCLHHKFEPISPRRRAASSPTPRARPTLSSHAPLTPQVCSNPSPSTRPPLSTFSPIKSQPISNPSPIVIQPISNSSPIVHKGFSSPYSCRQAFSSSSSSHQPFNSPSSSIQQNLKSLSSSHQPSSSPASSKHQVFSRPSPSNQPYCSSTSSIHQVFSSPSPSHQAFSSPSSNIQQAFTSPSPGTQLANGSSSLTTPQSLTSSVCSPKVFGLPYENNKTKNITALNAALKEIAKVSEELCSYQDEIKKKSERRSDIESFSFLQDFEKEENVKNQARNGDINYTQSPWCDFQLLEEQDWISWEGTVRDLQSRPPQKKVEAPPVPLRTSSWYSQHSTVPEHDLPEYHTDYKQSCGVGTDKKSSSPSVLRKFGVMLQENEGKTLTDSGVVTNLVPADSKCNISCCHSRWSWDGSRFGSRKASSHAPIMTCDSEAPKEKAPVSGQNGGLRPHWDRLQPVAQDSLKVTLEPPSYSDPRMRNEILELKAAEFNRIVFQAGTGREFMEGRLPPEHLLQQPDNQTKGSFSKDPSQTQVKPNIQSMGDQMQCLKDQEDLAAFSQSISNKAQRTKPGGSTQRAGELGTSGCLARDAATRARSRVLNEQPWKPGTLAAYPRPADSRSNYGAIEKIVKSYHGDGGSDQYQPRRPCPGKEGDLIGLLDMLELEQQCGRNGRLSHIELQSTATFRGPTSAPSERKNSPLSVRKSFSRPARPQNQRPPSRWASRSPSASADRPAPSPTSLSNKQALSLSCQTETIIL